MAVAINPSIRAILLVGQLEKECKVSYNVLVTVGRVTCNIHKGHASPLALSPQFISSYVSRFLFFFLFFMDPTGYTMPKHILLWLVIDWRRPMVIVSGKAFTPPLLYLLLCSLDFIMLITYTLFPYLVGTKIPSWSTMFSQEVARMVLTYLCLLSHPGRLPRFSSINQILWPFPTFIISWCCWGVFLW